MTLKKTSKGGARIAVVLGVLLLAAAVSMLAEGNGPGTKVAGTLYSVLGPTGWSGNAVWAIGSQTVAATYSCQGPMPNLKPSGALYGTETCTFTLTDGSGTFELQNEFTALPDSAPGLYTMHTISTVANGTGKFSGASGQLNERAEFILPGALGEIPVPALGKSEGVIFGLQ